MRNREDKETESMGSWRYGSSVKNNGCSHKGPWFSGSLNQPWATHSCH